MDKKKERIKKKIIFPYNNSIQCVLLQSLYFINHPFKKYLIKLISIKWKDIDKNFDWEIILN